MAYTKEQQIKELQVELEHRQEIEDKAIDLIAKGEYQKAVVLLYTLDNDKIRGLANRKE